MEVNGFALLSVSGLEIENLSSCVLKCVKVIPNNFLILLLLLFDKFRDSDGALRVTRTFFFFGEIVH